MKSSTKMLLLSTALTIVSSSPVFAEGWSGFSIGVGGGGNFAATDLDSYGEGFSEEGSPYAYMDTLDDYHPDSLTSADENEDGLYNPVVDMGKAGAFGTVEMGADLQQAGSQFVVGLAANYDFGKTKLGNSAFDSDINGDNELSTNLTLGNSWAVGGRLGFLPTDSTLIFASGGFQRTKANLENNFNATISSNTWDVSSSSSEWLNGFYVGGGVETKMTEQVSLKLEYRYADLKSISSSGTEGSTVYDLNSFTLGSAVQSTVDPAIQSVRATINLRF